MTVDKKSQFDRVSKSSLEANRASNVRGTGEYELAQKNKEKLSAWASKSCLPTIAIIIDD